MTKAVIHLYTLNVYSLKYDTRAQHAHLPGAVAQFVSMADDDDTRISSDTKLWRPDSTHQQTWTDTSVSPHPVSLKNVVWLVYKPN